MKYTGRIKLAPRLLMGVGRQGNWDKIAKRALAASAVAGFIFLVGQSMDLSENEPKSQVLGVQVSNSGQQGSGPFAEHAIASGETLFSIAQNYDMSWTALATLNNLEPPFVITPGQIIKVPRQ